MPTAAKKSAKPEAPTPAPKTGRPKLRDAIIDAKNEGKPALIQVKRNTARELADDVTFALQLPQSPFSLLGAPTQTSDGKSWVAWLLHS